jgi:Lar family restriction alleviation protein
MSGVTCVACGKYGPFSSDWCGECPATKGLRPCPFCGGEPYKEPRLDDNPLGDPIYVGECKQCHAMGPKEGEPETARDAWNKRARP